MRSRACTIAAMLSAAALGGCGPTVGTRDADAGASSSAAAATGQTDDGTTHDSVTAAADGTATAGSGDGTATTGTTEALPPGCSCVTPRDDGWSCDDIAHTQCEVELVCPAVYGTCPRPNPDLYACDTELQYDEADLSCVLQALRDRTTGRVQISSETMICGFEGCGDDLTEITIVPDGPALVRTCWSNPISARSSTSALRELAEPAYFQGCIELASGPARVQCLLGGLGEPVDAC